MVQNLMSLLDTWESRFSRETTLGRNMVYSPMAVAPSRASWTENIQNTQLRSFKMTVSSTTTGTFMSQGLIFTECNIFFAI